MTNRWGNNGNIDRLFSCVPKSLQMVTAAMKLKELAPWKKSYDRPRLCIKKQRHYFANKGPYHQSCGFSSSQVEMWELDHKESWAPKNWCFLTVMLEKTLESPLDYKKIKSVCPKGNQAWIFTGTTDGEAEAPIFWPPDAKSWLIRRFWCWGRLKAGGDGDDKGRDGWMASVTQWTWVWAHSRRWWRTGKPGVLQSVGSQRVRHWATKQLEGEDACGEQRLKPSKTWSRQGEDLSRIFDATAGFTDQSLPRPAPGLGKKREL